MTGSLEKAGPERPARGILLEVSDLRTHFPTDDGLARAVDGLSLTLHEGETVGLVGESGCGKSVTALSILGLVPPPGRVVSGSVRFHGTDVLQLPEEELRALRGDRIAMVFQEPMTALNPVFTVGNQVAEAIELHTELRGAAAWDRAVAMLKRVGIPAAERRARDYPHRLSGGMRQRVMLAMAMSCSPDLLIADEPTTALDVTIQAQILELLRDLTEQTGMGLLLITHDLGLVAEMTQRVAVMYAGRIVETGATTELLERPRHPYTIGLLRSLPDRSLPGERLATIPGTVPAATRFPSGCRFRTRCPIASERCEEVDPATFAVDPGDGLHQLACHHPEEAQGL